MHKWAAKWSPQTNHRFPLGTISFRFALVNKKMKIFLFSTITKNADSFSQNYDKL